MAQSVHSYLSRPVCCWILLALFWLALPVFSQIDRPAPDGPTTAHQKDAGDYIIGPEDVLTIAVADFPELTGKFRVSEAGYLTLPGLPVPVKAEGCTERELSRKIADALQAAELLRDPMVHVFVEEYHSRTVTVVGAVAKPSVYPLQKPTTLLEVLSLAGGLLPSAGTTAVLVRKDQPSRVGGPSDSDRPLPGNDSTLTIDLAKLMVGKDPSSNVEVRAGDVVSVATAPFIYVVGAVVKPGGFVLQDPDSGITVLKALAMAQGLKPIAAGGRSMIVRRSGSGSNQQEIPIDVTKLMAGKLGDRPLEPNDILFIPESGTKKALSKTGEIATQMVSGLALYGIYH
jgi:polysaccharide biosynthesis/export protein